MNRIRVYLTFYLTQIDELELSNPKSIQPTEIVTWWDYVSDELEK